MFLKRCVRKKCGKNHVYWQLVESIRTPRGSRHRMVAYLGELQAGEQKGLQELVKTKGSERRQIEADTPHSLEVATKGHH